MSLTPSLQLNKPDRGALDWDTSLNQNADKIDAAIGGVITTVDDLPEVYRYTGTFNGSTGAVISLPKTVDSVNEYSVEVTPTSRASTIGDIYVTKAVDQVTVHCSGGNTSDSFEVNIRYLGDVNSYGGSIYRRYYVSPSTSITDHANASVAGSIANIVAAIGTTPAIMVLPGNRTYTIDSDIDLSARPDLYVQFDPGAVLARNTGDETITFYAPENIKARPQQIVNADMLAFEKSGVVYGEWWGAKGDGSTNDTNALQYALNALFDTNGGVLQLLGKNYVANIAIPTNGHNIGIMGIRPNGAWQYTEGRSTLTAAAAGYVLDTPSGQVDGLHVEGVYFYGLGAGTSCGGARLQNAYRGVVRDCVFRNFADEGLLIVAGTACQIDYCMGLNCLMNKTRSAKIGVFDITGADFYIHDNEVSASQSAISDSNAYICAFKIGRLNEGGTHFIRDNVAEFADIGFHILSSNNRIIGNRADNNFGHGFEFGQNCSYNNIIGNYSLRNSLQTDNGYDAFNVDGSCTLNVFVGNIAQAAYTGSGNRHRYGFYDAQAVGDLFAKNIYVGNKSYNHQTAMMGVSNTTYGACNDVLTSSPTYFTDGDTTPNVDQGKYFILNYSSPTTITNFDNGTPGQEITIMPTWGCAAITIQNGSNLFTNIRANKVLKEIGIYKFRYFSGAWYEVGSDIHDIDTTGAGAGADGTISSRTGNALGECNGFVKMPLRDGTTAFVPYWTNIYP